MENGSGSGIGIGGTVVVFVVLITAVLLGVHFLVTNGGAQLGGLLGA